MWFSVTLLEDSGAGRPLPTLKSPPASSRAVRQALWAAAAFLVGLLVAILAASPAVPASDDDPFRPAALAGDPARGKATLDAPTWEVGEAWRVSFLGQDPACWLVVVRATASGYEQGASCPRSDEGSDSIATQIAVYDTPYLGRFDVGLAGSGGATRFFDWPLYDGKQWTTEYGGDEVMVRASAAEDGFIMEMGYELGSPFLRYDYDPELEWWSIIRFEQGWQMQVVEHTDDYRGTVAAADAELAVATERTTVPPSTVLADPSFDVSDTFEFVVLIAQRPNVGVQYLEVVSPSESEPAVLTTAPFVNEDRYDFRMFEAEPGTWQLRESGAGNGRFYTALHVVDVQHYEF